MSTGNQNDSKTLTKPPKPSNERALATDEDDMKNDPSRPAGDGGQTLEEARENGRRGAEKARQMRESGELSADNEITDQEHQRNKSNN